MTVTTMDSTKTATPTVSTKTTGTTSATAVPPALPDPLPVLRGIGSLRRLTGTYPPGHPMVVQRLKELEDAVRTLLRHGSPARIDVVHGVVHLNGVSYPSDAQSGASVGQVIQDLLALGVESVHVHDGVEATELHALSQFLWEMNGAAQTADAAGDSVEAQLRARGVRHVSLGRLVPVDTRWRAQQWPEAPGGPIDPAYAEALLLTQQTFEQVASGRALQPGAVRDLVQLLMFKVARSNAALSQILAVKQYENLTYCHSVNVSMLSLLLGRQIGLDEDSLASLVEGALLHDIGKTKVPLEIVKKPGALDKQERRLMEAHTTLGAEILAQTPGLRPLTPTVALEHHRTVTGFGYPDIGDGVIPHPMSQIVSVADIYEALTGARTYQAPRPPERACLILARIAGDKLNTALVKTFVNAVTFFPIGSLVRTSGEELAVVVRTTPGDPLHPVVVPVDELLNRAGDEFDTSVRDDSGAYRRHVLETVRPPVETFDVLQFLDPIAA
jgi:putative nucleotidyltransferase with HDIG domain